MIAEVRGILCRHCNHLLGKARDKIDTLLSAADYLRRASL
jgi:exonuclease VII small subunit